MLLVSMVPSASGCSGGDCRGPWDVSQDLSFPWFFVINALEVWERVLTFHQGCSLSALLFTDLISGHS